MAQYPSTVASFTTKQTADTIEASHINGLQDELEAITDGLLNGVAHALKPSTTNTRDLGTTSKRFRDLFLSGDAAVAGDVTVVGDVTADNFIGDGSGLTGVSTIANLDDLADVLAPTPSNGQFLTWNAGSSKWVNQTLTIEDGGVAELNDLTDVVLTSPAEGDFLKYVSGQWVNAQPTALPRGTVSYTMRSTAPSGYIFFDGGTYLRATYSDFYAEFSAQLGAGNGTTTFTTPDGSRRVVVGKAPSGAASTLSDTGGAWDHTHTGPSHTHDGSSLTVASHNHAAGTLAVSAHTHAVGTLVSSAHTHGAGSLVADDHAHDTGTLGTANESGHTHSTPDHTHTIAQHSHTGTTDGPNSPQTIDGGSITDVSKADHTHTFTTDDGGATSTGNNGASTTGAGSAHAHSVTGSTAVASASVSGTTGSTTPTLSGSTASTTPTVSGNTGSTSPAVSGNTGAGGTGATGLNNQAYLVLNMMVRV